MPITKTEAHRFSTMNTMDRREAAKLLHKTGNQVHNRIDERIARTYRPGNFVPIHLDHIPDLEIDEHLVEQLSPYYQDWVIKIARNRLQGSTWLTFS